MITANDRQPMTSYLRSVVTTALSRSVFEIFTAYVVRPRGRFGHFWWPYGDRSMPLLARGFLLVFSVVNIALKRTIFELGAWPRRSDNSFSPSHFDSGA